MIYKKCRECKYACLCCSSRCFDRWPKCSSCTNSNSEYTPAVNIVYCPLDGKRIEHPLYDINGNLVRE